MGIRDAVGSSEDAEMIHLRILRPAQDLKTADGELRESTVLGTGDKPKSCLVVGPRARIDALNVVIGQSRIVVTKPGFIDQIGIRGPNLDGSDHLSPCVERS